METTLETNFFFGFLIPTRRLKDNFILIENESPEELENIERFQNR